MPDCITIGKILHGNLLVTTFIGSGAMGSVYVAENVNLPDKKYAIKVLRNELTDDASFQARFYQEAQNQSKLDHPNIVDVIDYFEENGCYFLVQAYVEGRPLNKIIEDEGPLPEQRALSIFSGILQGLDCAHKHGIVHRDVKPSNVLIDNDGRARITDFGIAIQAGTARMTATGTAVGTAAYMSPEQIVRPQNVDHRSDVYSAGIVLYEMVTGKVPFDGGTDFAIQEQQVRRAPPNPGKSVPGLSVGLCRIILKALEKDPAKRYAGCREFLAEIESCKKVPPPPPVITKLLVWGAGGIAALGIAVFLFQSHVSRTPLPTETETRSPHEAPTTPLKTEAPVALVAAAGQALEYFCQNLAQIPSKKEGKRLSGEIGDSARADQFERQIGELEANMKDHAAQYREDMLHLSRLDTAAVLHAFSDIAAISKPRWQAAVLKDYNKMKERYAITPEAMQANCS